MAAYDNIIFTKGTDIVYVATIQVEENIINTLKVITTPTTATTPDTSLILNLNRVEDRYTINGILNYGQLNASETKTTARDKKELLKTMFSKGSVVVMTYEGTNYNVAVEKFNIRYKAGDMSDSVDGEAVYSVIITCVVGGDIS
jgi:hypothetical protein